MCIVSFRPRAPGLEERACGCVRFFWRVEIRGDRIGACRESKRHEPHRTAPQRKRPTKRLTSSTHCTAPHRTAKQALPSLSLSACQRLTQLRQTETHYHSAQHDTVARSLRPPLRPLPPSSFRVQRHIYHLPAFCCHQGSRAIDTPSLRFRLALPHAQTRNQLGGTKLLVGPPGKQPTDRIRQHRLSLTSVPVYSGPIVLFTLDHPSAAGQPRNPHRPAHVAILVSFLSCATNLDRSLTSHECRSFKVARIPV